MPLAYTWRPGWTRRRFVRTLTRLSAGVAVVPLVGHSRRAAATVRPGNVIDISDGHRGVTLRFEMAHGPFPCRGHSHTDATTYVFVPHHFRQPESARIDTIVHFHGHSTTARASMERHQLREQLHDSRQNAILVMPQGPVNASDSSGGQLDREDGFHDFLKEVRKTLQTEEVRDALGEARITRGARIGVCLISAHSGGYQVAARCAERGGFDVTEIYLFDALYGDVEAFAEWVIARRDRGYFRERHKIVSFFGTGTNVARNNRRLMERLSEAGIRYVHEASSEPPISRDAFIRNRAVFIESGTTHSGVTHRENNLRDALFASCFERDLATDWFDERETPREIELRAE